MPFILEAKMGEVTYTYIGYTSARKCVYHIEIETKFNLIHEHGWSGNTVISICKEYDVSRKTYYKWKNRYNREGVAGLYDQTSLEHPVLSGTR